MVLVLLTVPELQKVLDIGRDTAYSLVRRRDFPSVKLGREYRVLEHELGDWLYRQQRNK
jgi:excisionase family DNA binding protein